MFTVPVGDWFKGKLKPLCEDLLLSDKARDRKYFNYDYVQKLFEDHCSGDSNNSETFPTTSPEETINKAIDFFTVITKRKI